MPGPATCWGSPCWWAAQRVSEPRRWSHRATYRQTRTLPRRSEESLEITVCEPPSRIVITGQLGPFHATTSYLLEPAAGGTQLANDVELSPVSALLRPVAPLATASIKAAVARNLSTLKELLEGAGT